MEPYKTIKFRSNEIELDVLVSELDQTAWLTQQQIAIMFNRSQGVISRHIKKILTSWGSNLSTSLQKMHKSNLTFEGNYRPPKLYNLDIILLIGNKINSEKGEVLKRFVENYFNESAVNSQQIIILIMVR